MDIYTQLKTAVDAGTISRKTACRSAIKFSRKNEYIALLINIPLNIINKMIDIDDNFINDFDGTEIADL